MEPKFGGLWEPLRVSLERLGSILGRLWDRLGGVLGRLGGVLGRLGRKIKKSFKNQWKINDFGGVLGSKTSQDKT